MAAFKVKYLKTYADRHGRLRSYYRRPGFPSVTLPGAPGSMAFALAYEAAAATARPPIGAERTAPGSFNAAIVAYYGSSAYQRITPRTQRTYRNVLERFRAEFGDMPLREMTPARLDRLLDRLSAKPGAQEGLRKVLRLVLKLAVRRGMLRTSPMDGLRLPRKPLKGFRAWTEDDAARFEARWPIGSRERLAFALLLYTAQRRSDVVRMGRQHIAAGAIRVVQGKGGTVLHLPLAPPLKLAIAAAIEAGTPSGAHLTFLTTAYGQPFSPAGFTAWFVKRCQQAGLPDGCAPPSPRLPQLLGPHLAPEKVTHPENTA